METKRTLKAKIVAVVNRDGSTELGFEGVIGKNMNPLRDETRREIPVLFKSWTKEMTQEEAVAQGYLEGLPFDNYNRGVYDKDRDIVIYPVAKYHIKDGVTPEYVHEQFVEAWEKNMNFSTEPYYDRVD